MAKLIIKTANIGRREIDLKPGTNWIGRGEGNDFQIDHPSVSAKHCQIIMQEGSVMVRDAGSTNGTFLDGERVTDALLRAGQTLHLGGVELELQAPAAASIGLRVARPESASSPGDVSAVSVSPARIVSAPAAKSAGFPGARPVAIPIVDTRTFLQRLSSAFAYPFERDGVILLVCGTVLFGVLDFVSSLPSLLSSIVGLMSLGYLSAYMQRIVYSSAQGENDLPDWPEFSNWWEDLVNPAILLIGSFAASFGPAIGFWIYFTELDPSLRLMIGLALGLFGCFCLPMALIATSMYESLFALNPLLIVPSMARIAKDYFIACMVLAVLVGLRLLTEILLGFIPIPVLPALFGGFVSLYLLVVEMRILGLLYYTKRDELNWSF